MKAREYLIVTFIITTYVILHSTWPDFPFAGMCISTAFLFGKGHPWL